MLRLSLISAFVCAALLANTAAYAQPRAPGPSINAAAATRLQQAMTPEARARIASQLAGATITPEAISTPVRVTASAPVVGDPRAPTLALRVVSAADWTSSGDDPKIIVTRIDGIGGMHLEMQVNAGYRYLVICSMQSNAFRANLGLTSLPITWDGHDDASTGAILIPVQTEERMVRLSMSTPMGTTNRAWVRSCEVSRLG